MKSYTQFVTKAHSHLSEAPYDWGSDPRWGFIGQLERQRRKAFGTDQEKAAAHSYERSVNDLSPGGRPRAGTDLPTYDQIQNRTRERRLADPNYPGKTGTGNTGSGSSRPAAPAPAPAKTFKVGDQQMSKDQIKARYDELRKSDPAKAKAFGDKAFAAVNPKLDAAAKERARTRGTSATTNPLMKDMKSGLPAPKPCLLYTSPSPRDKRQSRMPSSA